MELKDIPWAPILFTLGQIIAFVIWIISLSKKVDANENSLALLKQRFDAEMAEIKKENAELKRELRELRDILVKVENNTHLLMLGRIKTGAKE